MKWKLEKNKDFQSKITNKFQKRETVNGGCDLLIEEQLNWSHTQFACAWIGHVHSVYVRNIKRSNYHCNYYLMTEGKL